MRKSKDDLVVVVVVLVVDWLLVVGNSEGCCCLDESRRRTARKWLCVVRKKKRGRVLEAEDQNIKDLGAAVGTPGPPEGRRRLAPPGDGSAAADGSWQPAKEWGFGPVVGAGGGGDGFGRLTGDGGS